MKKLVIKKQDVSKPIIFILFIIIGKPSDQIEHLLGYVDEPELIHRDNLVVLS